MGDREHAFRRMIGDAEFVRKILIVLALILFVLLLWKLSDILLLAFGAILVALVLHASADLLTRYLHLSERWSLTAASLLILILFIGLAALFGAQIRSQLANVAERLPDAIDALGRNLGVGSITDDLSSVLDTVPKSGLAAQLAGIGGIILNGFVDFLLVIIAGLYIAASPRLYVQGLIKLFPISYHPRVESSLRASGEALKLWLLAQLIAMACVGVLSTLAYWLIGLPSPYALGLIAGLADFIPFLGPALGALPAVVIAFSIDGATALWTILAVLVIQQIEGNLILPLVARKVVSIPPALALFAIISGGVLFGTLGLVLGFPLAIVTYVLVKKLYVREVLGEETTVPGEAEAAKASQ